MNQHRIALTIATFATLICAPEMAMAQHKPIGQTQHQSTQILPSLIVMNARGATLQGGKLTLAGIAPNSIVFADRPHRAAGHDLTSRLLEEWAPGNTSAESSPRTRRTRRSRCS